MEVTTRRPSFIEEDDGLASLVDIEAGFSGNHHQPLLMKSSYFSASRRRARFKKYHQPHFLEACYLCRKPLGDNRDIHVQFVRRGDTPFCREECRQEQIEINEAKEKIWNLSAYMKTPRKEQKKSSSTPSKAQKYFKNEILKKNILGENNNRNKHISLMSQAEAH